MVKSEFILLEHRTTSLESTTCEASTQQTHLTILAAVLRHLILLQNADLELQLMYCIPPAFPRTRLQSMAFLFKCYHKLLNCCFCFLHMLPCSHFCFIQEPHLDCQQARNPWLAQQLFLHSVNGTWGWIQIFSHNAW